MILTWSFVKFEKIIVLYLKPWQYFLQHKIAISALLPGQFTTSWPISIYAPENLKTKITYQIYQPKKKRITYQISSLPRMLGLFYNQLMQERSRQENNLIQNKQNFTKMYTLILITRVPLRYSLWLQGHNNIITW